MTGNSKPKPRTSSGLTKPGDLYVPGDSLPVPEVIEKDTDSAWALWSDAVEQAEADGEGAQTTQPRNEDEEDYGPDTIPMTEMMDERDPSKGRK